MKKSVEVWLARDNDGDIALLATEPYKDQWGWWACADGDAISVCPKAWRKLGLRYFGARRNRPVRIRITIENLS